MPLLSSLCAINVYMLEVAGVLSALMPELWPQWKDDKNCVDLEGRSGLW